MNKPKASLNSYQRLVWTLYLFVLLTIFLSDLRNGSTFITYLVLGWIPFLIAHLIWRNKKDEKEAIYRRYNRLKNALIVLNGKDNKLKTMAEKEFKNKDYDKFLLGMALHPNEGWAFLDDIYEALGEKEHNLARETNEKRATK